MNDQPEWVKTRVAERLLGISERTLFRLRKDKTLLPGSCWRRSIPHNLNSNVLYHIPSCLEVLSGVAAASEIEKDIFEKTSAMEVS